MAEDSVGKAVAKLLATATSRARLEKVIRRHPALLTAEADRQLTALLAGAGI
ncbi:hypothetical protein [Nonomuraea aurantiaca]|uniref:hypothetical protein n=1 Tax=Nonomuraea aurantiaca TaxID=2878562 RepID=UPI001CDA158F|nr:hypothetical protein [Nonomuraea aurantiaca]MCA2225159.1 hypothetical protein [Nonomuraea aurantiaca]